jgi:putative alpha-1,2-mannosidase
VKLDGKPLNDFWFLHRQLTAGGRLEIVLGPNPGRWAFGSRQVR